MQSHVQEKNIFEKSAFAVCWSPLVVYPVYAEVKIYILKIYANISQLKTW